jgi:hypothetical protein
VIVSVKRKKKKPRICRKILPWPLICNWKKQGQKRKEEGAKYDQEAKGSKKDQGAKSAKGAKYDLKINSRSNNQQP